jgi:tetratricopeptide (TPR) repeat protein
MFFGPTPVPEGVRRCEEIRAEVVGNPGSEGWALRALAGLHAMVGRFDLARTLLAEANEIFEELGQTRYSSAWDLDGIVELLAGDLDAAERLLRAGYLALEKMGDRAFRPTTAAYLAEALYAQGRDEEAGPLTEISEQLAAREDLLTQVVWRRVRAKVMAREGRVDEAEDLAQEAVTISESTDFLNTRADALVDLAHVHRRAGRLDEARTALAKGLALYEEKGNQVAAKRTRADLAVLKQT